MLNVSPTPPVRYQPPVHTFEPPGDGRPVCVHPGCGQARSAMVHTVALTRTRVVLVIDHNQAVTPEMLELLIAQTFGTMPDVTLQQMQPLL